MKIHNILVGMSLALTCCYLATITTGCAKNRLFTHVDSIPEIPSQFHLFNNFAYDSSLSLSVDGLARENVKSFGFSQYYPSSSAFNLNAEQPNSKLINTADPSNQSLFDAQATFQFEPLTSYLVFYSYGAYDTLYTPERTIVPKLMSIPEDINTPADGTARVRFFDLTANGGQSSLSIAPNSGAGTTLSVGSPYLANAQTNESAASTYQGTSPGTKVVKLTMPGQPTLLFTYLPANLGNYNYTFFAVGDQKNYLNGIQPQPKLYVVQDGDPSTLQALTLSSLTYPGNSSSTFAVTVVNGAYNISGMIEYGSVANNNLIQYPFIDVTFNQYKTTVLRWELEGSPAAEDVGSTLDPGYPYPSKLLGGPQQRIENITGLTPGIYTSNVTPHGLFAPQYDVFNSTYEAGNSYTVCLVPEDTSASHCSTLIVQNDQSPDPKLFKLRFINLVGGAPQLDVHVGSPTGPVLAAGVPFAQATSYLSLTGNATNQDLYITSPGTSDLLFPEGQSFHPIISIPYTAGNSATIFLMGLLPNTPYSGDPGYFGPYSLYNTDAYLNINNAYQYANPVQLFY